MTENVTRIRFEIIVDGDRRIVEVSKPVTIQEMLDSPKMLGWFLRGIAGLLPKESK